MDNISAAPFRMCDDFFRFIRGGAEAAAAFRVRASAPTYVSSLTRILGAARMTGLTLSRSEESLKRTCTETA